MEVATVLVFVVVFLLGLVFLHRPKNLPPGPINWPIIGCLPFMLRKSSDFRAFMLLCNKMYGNIMYFPMGLSDGLVFVSRFDLIKKLFVQNGDVTSNRPREWLINKLFKNKGIVFNTDTWKETKKFASTAMKDFGMGKDRMERNIQEEAQALCDAFLAKDRRPFNPNVLLCKAVSNVTYHVVIGKRYHYDDVELEEVQKKIQEFFEINLIMHPLNSFPVLRHLGFLFKKFSVEAMKEKYDAVLQFLKKEIENHRKSFDPDNPIDMIDLYLKEESTGFIEHPSLNEDQLFCSIIDLLLAGTDTSTGTLGWNLLYMINFPEIQNKCREEIHRELGTSKLVEYSYRTKLPYTMATLQEVMRLSPIASGTLAHVSEKPLELEGYSIPVNTKIYGFTLPIYTDRAIWGDDADSFRPERWLSDDGNLRKVSEFIPFGIGKRICAGENLARTEIFILMVTLLQKIKFRAEDPRVPPTLQGILGLTYVPQPFNLIAEPL